MQNLNEQDRRRVILAVSLLAGIVAMVAILGFMGLLAPLYQGMWEIFRGKEQLRSYIESWGAWAPVVFIVVQALQVVMAPIPGEFTGAVGGFIFGTVPSLLYSTAGLTVGSGTSFSRGQDHRSSPGQIGGDSGNAGEIPFPHGEEGNVHRSASLRHPRLSKGYSVLYSGPQPHGACNFCAGMRAGKNTRDCDAKLLWLCSVRRKLDYTCCGFHSLPGIHRIPFPHER